MTKEMINDILQLSGLYSVGGPQDIGGIEAALEKLGSAVGALGAVGRTLIAEAATKHLRSIGIERASKLVDGALRVGGKPATKSRHIEITPPSNEPVNGDALAADLYELIERYIWLPKWAAVKLMLFAIYTYVFESFDTSPLLVVTSAEPESGKSRVLDVMGHLVRKPWRVTASSTPVLFRYVHAEHPTVLFDEFDNVDLSSKRDLIAVLNVGHSRSGAFVPRCVGDNHEPTLFDVFAPKIVAGIGQFLPATTWSRAVLIEMKTQPSAGSSARLVHSEADVVFRHRRASIHRWVRDNEAAINNAAPVVPNGLSDRAVDSWTPLFVIADLLGERWGVLARRAALESTDGNFANVSEGRLLLSHVREIVETRDDDRIPSRDLVEALRADEDWPWRERGKKGLTPIELAKLLRPYGIRPKPLHFKHMANAKGYYYKDLRRAFDSHLRNLRDEEDSEFHDDDATDAKIGAVPDDITGITGTPPEGPGDVDGPGT